MIPYKRTTYLATICLLACGLIEARAASTDTLRNALPAAADAAQPESVYRGDGFQRGIALGLYSQDTTYDYQPLLAEIRATGANSVSLVFALTQRDVHSNAVRPQFGCTVTDWRLRQTIRAARQLDLQTLLLPIVLLEHPERGDWRGKLSPRLCNRWFANYRDCLLHYAELAEQEGAEQLAIGSELVSLEQYSEQWTNLIRAVRLVYHGKLTYSANWDQLRVVQFWDQLDWLGMTGYFELSQSAEPKLAALTAKWRKIQQDLDRWRAAKLPGRKIYITEIGYANRDGTNMRPWDHTSKNPPDPAEQQMCFQAFFAAWNGVDWLGGVYIYDWFGPGGAQDASYSPRNKPAAAEIAKWYGGGKE